MARDILDITPYQARWVGEDADLMIDGIDEQDMTEAELQSENQAVAVYTKKQVADILENYANGKTTI
ncbi:hypothetical protein [Leuconostoc citreum]